MIRYIIDGHNLIHTIPAYLELMDRSYIRALEAVSKDVDTYVHSKKVKAILIFDGNPPGEPAETSPGLTIIFSGADRDADSVIADRARLWQAPQTVVVSRDRRVKETAVSLGCQTASPQDFYRLVRFKRQDKLPRPPGPKAKSEGLAPHQVEAWKKVFQQALIRKKKDDRR